MGLKSIADKAKSIYSIIGLVIIFAGGAYFYTKGNEIISIIVAALVLIVLAVWDLYDKVSKMEKELKGEK